MRKLNNIEIFQGKKYLSSNKNYFEGWYFKNSSDGGCISFIPGISINDDEKISFIQVITDDNSWIVDYNIDDFEYNDEPFWIRIGNNYFSKERVHIDINDKELGLNIKGDLKYKNHIYLKRNIMGFFSYIPFMQCSHSILSMKNKVEGNLFINDNNIEFLNGTGYIEKDFGVSFPKYYIWGQGNNFNDKDVSFFISVANIPFKMFNFRGFICSLIVNGKEYRFATYNNSKILKYEINDNGYNIILKRGKYILEVDAFCNDSFLLKAPVNGKIDKEIFECINGKINITLKKNKKIIFLDESYNCGIEMVNE